jgi:DNA-binding SARP family transcriptional activator
MARWRVRLFGQFELVTPKGESLQVSDTVAAIFGYLTTRPGMRGGRATIAYQIWPKMDEVHARRCLATSLWRLKKQACAPALPIQAEGEILRLDPRVWIDARAIEFHLSRIKGNGFLQIQQLRRALQVYRGAFLDGHYEEWVFVERERLFYLHLDAQVRLANLEMSVENWSGAIESARRVCMLEPLREDAHRLLMLAYAKSGNRALALKQYRTCSDILMRELGVLPMEETRQLAVELQNFDMPRDPADYENNQLGQSALRTALIDGRAAISTTLAALERAIDLV